MSFIKISYITHVKKGYSSNYASGIRAEKSIASTYRSNGWSVYQSPGSRGAADLKCQKG